VTQRSSLTDRYFDALYARDPDPWRFATSAYERAKYDATLDALPRPRFDAALEIGCSIGVLTRRLAGRCGTLLAIDVAAAALDQARLRCADLGHVSFRRSRIPEQWPDGRFDLILLSEVLYYLDPPAIARAATCARASLRIAGAALLVHYVLPTDYPCSGDEATDVFLAQSGLTPVLRQRTAEYRIDLLQA